LVVTIAVRLPSDGGPPSVTVSCVHTTCTSLTAAQLRTVGHQIEREQHHRQRFDQDAEGRHGQVDDLALLAANELLHRTVFVVDRRDHLRGVDVGVELVVEEVDRAVDVLLRVAEQRGDLLTDERSDGDDERQEREEHPDEDQDRRRAATPSACCQPIDARLDRE